MKHVMLDLETMGVSAGCAIVSIGAVEFDPKTGKLGREFYCNVDLQSCADAGLRMDASTVMWWLGQSDAARQALTHAGTEDLSYALALYAAWIPENAFVWSHGASFDHTVLLAAYKAVGLPPPWIFRNERDTRTIFDLSGVKVGKIAGTAHNALDDARAQALAVMEAYQALRLP